MAWKYQPSIPMASQGHTEAISHPQGIIAIEETPSTHHPVIFLWRSKGGGAPPLGFPESTLPAPLAFGHCTAHTKDFLAGTDRPAATALLVPRKSRACVFWRGPLHCSYQAKILESSAGFNSAEVRGGGGGSGVQMYVCTSKGNCPQARRWRAPARLQLQNSNRS